MLPEATTPPDPVALAAEARRDYFVCAFASVHDGLRDSLRSARTAEFLTARGWRLSRTGRWCRYGHRRYGVATALREAAALDVARWLRERGWRVLPDGSRASTPSHVGLIRAARLERGLAPFTTSEAEA